MLHAVERVLDHEAVVERVDDAVVVGATALALVAVGQRGEVLGAGRLAPEDVVPDDAVVGVELLDDVDAAVLIRVEERLAELADLVLVHQRRPNFPESRYSNSLVILPSRTSATRHADSATSAPVVGHDVARVLHDEAVVEGVDDAVVVGAPPVQLAARGRARRGCRRGSITSPVRVEPHRHVGCVAPLDRVDVAGLDRVEERVAEPAVLSVDAAHHARAPGRSAARRRRRRRPCAR